MLTGFGCPRSGGHKVPAPLARARGRRAPVAADRLEPRTLLSGTLVVSEFLASNTATLSDADGQFNDWIEVHNTGAAPASAAGYALTDDPAAPAKWVFPDVTVPAGGYLVVFASGKDRRVAGQELHTNFSLNGDGEYLALVEPGGAAATQFAPTFPPQEPDVSYGVDPAPGAGQARRSFATPTPGAANVRSEVVINEIHYDPDVKTELTEFVELHNPGAAAVDLSGAYFSEGVTYAFPAGTTLPAGGYLVVAQDAAQFQSKFGTALFAQYAGSLSNEGESVTLRNVAGGRLDTVDFRPGFPWPTVGDAPGYSIELINPDFDNSVGGNWRAHAAASSLETTLLRPGATWRYLKGLAEASSPASDWRGPNFDDTSWAEGAAPLGYDGGGVPMRTPLDDMRGVYTSVFLRTAFDVADPASFSGLRLEAMADDGFNVWVNGLHAAAFNVPSAEMAFDATAAGTIEDNAYKTYTLSPGVLRAGRNVIAVQFFNVSLAASSDAFFDAKLVGTTGGGGGASPTPGLRNSVFADNAAPQMRQVNHFPQQPAAGEIVTLTAKVTDPDGVAGVTLQYQLVDPGNYINLDDPAYQSDWTGVPMNDAGADGDAAAGDGVYTAQLPASVQVNRRLVRYRVTAADTRGASVTAPYADDSVPNFAYFVYNGVPGWSGAARPGATPVVNYGADVMNSVPSYHLISKNSDVEDATWFSKYGGDNYLWKGTLVYDGVVYDHISYRARGGVWRYAMVKNMWKFDFNHNHGFQAKDDYGRPYSTTWDKLNLGANIQQADFGYRGEQGLFESVGMKLFNLAGVTAPRTSYVQLRVVDDAAETGATQYDGDLWGLYLAVQQPDGKFLDEHDLPDGNLYKMEGGTGELNNQGPTQPSDKSDLNAFMSGYQTPSQTDQWFRDNMNLDSYYGYRAIVEAIHHYDIDESAGKNYFFYHNPVTDQWQTTVWDLDLTWADTMYGGGVEPFKSRVLPRPAFSLEYKNRIREIRDLLYNPDQTGALVDEMAAKVYTPGQPSIVDVDRAMWDWNPRMASPNGESSSPGKAGQGRFYQAGTSKDFQGMMQKMKAYVGTRGTFLDNLARDTAIPNKPTVTYLGPAGFPADNLRFHASDFADPNGNETFAAMEWRVAEITSPSAPGYDPKAPKKYEISAAWESGELTSFSGDVSIPAGVVEPGKTYRVRVRMKDATGRWSNWSAVTPGVTQFVAGAPDASVKDSLRITELHYHPAPNPAGPPAEDEFEFVELQNTGAAAINLRGVHFTHGVSYTFDDAVLEPGAYVVVAVNRDAFVARYGTAGINLAPGVFTGHLDNTGERVRLLDSNDQPIQDFVYSDAWYPTTDGSGPSLVVRDPTGAPAALNQASGWRPSVVAQGSPGRADAPVVPPSTIVARQVFYNNSAFDGADPAASAADDGAIATDKAPLLPGAAAGSFANYTSYSRGINGIMIDVAGMPLGTTRGPIAGDFIFRVGGGAAADWQDAPAPTAIRVRRGAGAGGSDRITLVWADGAIKNQWLQVTVKANSITGLAAADVFTFGNLVGDTGDAAATAVVNAQDLTAAKRALNAAAGVTSTLDFDRSGRVNAQDLSAVKSNLNRGLALRPAPAPPAAAFSAVPISAMFAAKPLRVWDERPENVLG